MSPHSSISRRRLTLGLLGGAGLGCVGPALSSPGDGDLFAALRPLVEHGRRAIAARQWMAALTVLERALALVEADPLRNWPFRAYVLPPYGLALQEFGRAADAIDTLRLALEAEQRIEAEPVDERFKRLLASQAVAHSKVLLDVEFKRQFLTVVDVVGQSRPHALVALLFDHGAGAPASITLGRALAKAGRAAELLALYQDELRRLSPQLGPRAPEDMPSVSAEYRLFAFGVILASAGCLVQADDALARTLALSASRAAVMGTWVPSVEAHLGVFAIRRCQVWAAIGTALSLPADGERARCLVARIVESKGLGVRHAEQMRLLLARSFSPALHAACLALDALDDALEDELVDPMTDSDLLQAFLLRKVQASTILSAVMPALRRAGLGTVFVDGASVIRQAAAALPDGAFIGFLAYARLRPDASGFGERRYARYVVAGTMTDIQDIGSKREIDEGIHRWRHGALRRASVSEMARLGGDLRERLLGTLPAQTLERERWVLDPDSELCLLPFEALPGLRSDTLLEEHCISYVTSMANWTARPPPPAVGDARVIADPSYPNLPAGAGLKADLGRDNTGARRNLNFAPLPETRAEAAAVVDALHDLGAPVQLFVGRDATPQALAFDAAPRYLHVAAHGLMLNATRGSDDTLRSDVAIILPGRASALALADHESVRLVHAYEIQRLPLQGTELVVLSACDTGNGALHAGEGVASLRRAVEVAGAKASLTSLWPVPSAATVQLMKTFYARLAQGAPAAQALREAKIQLMQQDTAPMVWSGFLLAGRQ